MMVQSFLSATPPDGLIDSDQQFSGSSEPAPVIPDRADNLVARGETPTRGGDNGPFPASSSAHTTESADLAGGLTGQETVLPIDAEIAKHTEPEGGIDPKLATYTLAGIYEVHGLYELALKLLDVLESQGADPERIQDDRETITRLIQANGTDERPKSNEGSSVSSDNSKNFISMERPQGQIKNTSPNEPEADGVEIGEFTEPYAGYWREESLASESAVDTTTDSEIEPESQLEQTAPAPPTAKTESGQTDTETIPDHETAEEIIPPFEPAADVDTDLIGEPKAPFLAPETNFKADSPEDQLENASNDDAKEPEKAGNGIWLYGRLASKSAVETTTDTEIKPDSQIEERADEAAQSIPFTDNQAEAPEQDKSPVASSSAFQAEPDFLFDSEPPTSAGPESITISPDTGNGHDFEASGGADLTAPADLAGGQTGQETVVPIDAEIAKHTEPDGGIDPNLGTYTLVSIYKVRGQYELALKLLDVLESQGADPERIQDDRETITRLIQAGE